jgi:hypothetical protein
VRFSAACTLPIENPRRTPAGDWCDVCAPPGITSKGGTNAPGAGGLTLHNTGEVAALGLGGNTTYFAANVGGGVKWYAHRHWGLRADYRLLMVDDTPAAPEFFGRDGHRVYGGLLFNY